MLHSRSPDSEIASQAHINKLLWTDKSLAPKANICCSDTINPPRHWTSPHTILQLNVICPCTVKHVYCQHRIKWKKNKMIFSQNIRCSGLEMYKECTRNLSGRLQGFSVAVGQISFFNTTPYFSAAFWKVNTRNHKFRITPEVCLHCSCGY